MKVFFVADNFARGGFENHLLSFFKYLKRSEWFILFAGRFLNYDWYVDQYVDYIKNISFELYSTGSILEILDQLNDTICGYEIDFIHSHPFISIFSGFITSVKNNLPHAITIHGRRSFLYPDDISSKFLYNSILKNSVIFSVNKLIYQSLKKNFNYSNTFYLPNPIDTEIFKPVEREREEVAVVVSRLDEDKMTGIEKAVKILMDLKIPLKIVGDGNSKERLKREISGMNNVEFLGFLDSVSVSSLISTAKIVVGMGRVVAESILTKTPVLLAGYDGVKGLVTPERYNIFKESNFNGENVPTLTYNEIKSEIDSVFSGKYKVGDDFFNRVYDEFSSEKVVEKYRLIMENYLNGWNGYSKSEIDKAYFFENYVRCQRNYIYEKEKLNSLNKELDIFKKKTKQLEGDLKDRRYEIDELKRSLDKVRNKYDRISSEMKKVDELKEIYYKRLNEIYSSNLWKIGSKYYFLKSRIKNFFKKERERLNIDNTESLKNYSIIIDIINNVYPKFYYAPTVAWDIPLFQRPQHMAINISMRNYLFLFFEPEFKRKNKVRIIKKDLFVLNNWNEIYDSIDGGFLILPSTNSNIDVDNLMKLKAKKVKIIYDYIDEIHDDIAKGAHFQLNRHKRLKEFCDIALAVSERLRSEAVDILGGDRVLYLPNGCDYNHFHIQKDKNKIPPVLKELVEQQKPVIGYYGALAKWIDFDVINFMAEKRQDWIFLIIGVDYDGSLKKLNKNLKNIVVLGPVDYKILPYYAIWFDVGIIPFVRGRIAMATSPIKLFEYMAMNKVTVCSGSLIDCKKYRTPLIAEGKEDFLKKVEKAIELSEDKEFIRSIDKEARENTWDRRIDALLNFLSGKGLL